MSSGNRDFIPYTIQWAAVQAYYAVYLHLRAYFTCKNSSVGNEHATTLKSLSVEITNRPQLYIELLRIQCANDTEGKFTFSPLPTNENPNSISTLTTPNKANKYDFLATMLKTTREKQLETIYTQWKKENNTKQVRKTQKQKLMENLAPTTTINFLYRLRIRSNYADAESYLMSLENSDGAIQYYKSLKTVLNAALANLELIIARYIGKKDFGRLVEEICSQDKEMLSNSLKTRWDLIQGIW